jgi:hypothetical protein
MKFRYALPFALAVTGLAQKTVVSLPLIPADPAKDTHVALFVDLSSSPVSVRKCADGATLYVQRAKPADAKAQQGDFDSFYAVKIMDPKNPPIITSKEGQAFIPACFQVK